MGLFKRSEDITKHIKLEQLAFPHTILFYIIAQHQLPPKINIWLPSGGSEEPYTKTQAAALASFIFVCLIF